jgi:hypothetical protein
MVAVLSPIPARRRGGPEAPLRVVPPRPARPGVGPCRPLPNTETPQTETDPRCRPARPTRVGCRTESRPTRRGAAVRRRRVVLGTVAAGILVALALPWSGTGGQTLATPGPALAGGAVVAHGTYVIQPGDTLWSIAIRLDPTGDPRRLVAQLAVQVGGDTAVPGEHVVLP